MKSVRLDADIQARLRAAARLAGVSESVLIRQAIAKVCDEVLDQRLDRRLADSIGIIEGTREVADHSGDAFRERLLQNQHKE